MYIDHMRADRRAILRKGQRYDLSLHGPRWKEEYVCLNIDTSGSSFRCWIGPSAKNTAASGNTPPDEEGSKLLREIQGWIGGKQSTRPSSQSS